MKPTKDDMQLQAIPSIPLPSADLIVYRFDQLDKGVAEVRRENASQFAEITRRFDSMKDVYFTRDEATAMREDRDNKFKTIEDKFKDIATRLDSYTWYWRALFVAAISALFLAIAGFYIHR